MIAHCTLRKSLIYSVRSFGSPPSTVCRRIPTTLLETQSAHTHPIERASYRHPAFRSIFSGSSSSFDNQIAERGDDDNSIEEQPNEPQFMTGPNPGLASVISQGIKTLEQTAEEIQYKTRKITLSRAHKKPSFRNGGAADMDPRQLAEGQRILDVASECLEHLAMQEEQNGKQSGKGGVGNGGLVLFGEPIVLLECEVNRNVRQAKIYWTLPYGILLDNRINQKLYQDIMMKVQKELVRNGGAKLLARDVHTRLSYYYPPRIKLFPATDEMVQTAIEEFMS